MGALVGCEWLSLQGQFRLASPKLVEVQQGAAQSGSSGAKRIKSHEETRGCLLLSTGCPHPTA